MTGSLDFLSNIHAIQSYFIGFPNGSNAIANSEGTVTLRPDFIIHNILYVYDLMCNLISISQLLYFYRECDDYFSKNKCVIQDHTLEYDIGLDRLVHRVYNHSHMLITPLLFLWISYINSWDIRRFSC